MKIHAGHPHLCYMMKDSSGFYFPPSAKLLVKFHLERTGRNSMAAEKVLQQRQAIGKQDGELHNHAS